MRIVEKTQTRLHLRNAPWTRWSMAIVCLAFGGLSAADGHFESQLSCTQNVCVLSYNPFAVERFPRRELSALEAEQHPQKKQLARLVLVVRDEPVPFDLRYQDLRRIEAMVELANKPGDLHLGATPDTRRGLLAVLIALAAAIGISGGGRWVSLRFEGDFVTIDEGGVFMQSSRTFPVSDITGVREIDGRIVLGLPGGEGVEVSDVQLEASRQKLVALLKEACRVRV